MKTNISIFVILLQVLVLNFCPVHSEEKLKNDIRKDWPQWRGVNRDAISTETGLIKKFPEGGPAILWRLKIGEGFSSVSVSDGKLYTMWDEGGAQYLVCLEALSGKELWRQELGSGFKNGYGNGPRSTPTIDENAAFAIGTSGRLIAANKNTGKLLWEHNLVSDYRTKLPSYGFASSPLVIGEKLFVEVGGESATYMAFNKITGEVVWASQNDRPAYSSPVHASINGVNQIVFWSASGLHSISPDQGKILWKYAWEELCPVTGIPLNTSTPIYVAPDKIFNSGGSGAAVIQISSAGNKFDVKTIWKSEQMKNEINSSILFENHIYGFDGGVFKCINAETGKLKWKVRGFQKGSLIAADGQLIVLSERGKLALVDANPAEFIEKDSAQILNGQCWTAPTLAKGKLYLRNHNELVCLNMAKGSFSNE